MPRRNLKLKDYSSQSIYLEIVFGEVYFGKMWTTENTRLVDDLRVIGRAIKLNLFELSLLVAGDVGSRLAYQEPRIGEPLFLLGETIQLEQPETANKIWQGIGFYAVQLNFELCVSPQVGERKDHKSDHLYCGSRMLPP